MWNLFKRKTPEEELQEIKKIQEQEKLKVKDYAKKKEILKEIELRKRAIKKYHEYQGKTELKDKLKPLISKIQSSDTKKKIEKLNNALTETNKNIQGNTSPDTKGDDINKLLFGEKKKSKTNFQPFRL